MRNQNLGIGLLDVELALDGLLGGNVAVDYADLARGTAHSADEVRQVPLAGVGGVAAEGVDAGADRVTLAVELHPAASGSIAL